MQLAFEVSNRNRIRKMEGRKSSKRSHQEPLERIRTKHFEERRRDRKISERLIEICLIKGKKRLINGAVHYVLDNLHVVEDLETQALLTVYFRQEQQPDEDLEREFDLAS